MADIVGGDLKSHLTWPLKDISTRDSVLLAVDLLVDPGLFEADAVACPPERKVTLGVQFQDVPAFKVEANGLRGGSGFEHEVVLQVTLVAVIGQVGAGVDVLIEHPAVRGNPGAPVLRIVADEVVRSAWQWVQRGSFRRRIGARQLHAHHDWGMVVGGVGMVLGGSSSDLRRSLPQISSATRCPRNIPERQHRLVGRQEQRISAATSEKVHLAVRLTPVGLEAQRQNTVSLRQPGFRVRIGLEQ